MRFEWTAYDMENTWSGPDIHDEEDVLTWRSSSWGIECWDGNSHWSTDHLGEITRMIAEGVAVKAEESDATDNPRISKVARADPRGKGYLTSRETTEYLNVSWTVFGQLKEAGRLQPVKKGEDGTEFYDRKQLADLKKENL